MLADPLNAITHLDSNKLPIGIKIAYVLQNFGIENGPPNALCHLASQQLHMDQKSQRCRTEWTIGTGESRGVLFVILIGTRV